MRIGHRRSSSKLACWSNHYTIEKYMIRIVPPHNDLERECDFGHTNNMINASDPNVNDKIHNIILLYTWASVTKSTSSIRWIFDTKTH